MQKKYYRPKRSENIIFPLADGTAYLCRRFSEVRESTLRQFFPARSEDLREDLQGNSDRSQPSETHDDAEGRNDFCQS